jgi:hypothetical protein
MPRGRVEPREVECRACGVTFVSDRCGKAAFYCRRPECDSARGPRAQRSHATSATGVARAERDQARRARAAAKVRQRLDKATLHASELADQLAALEGRESSVVPIAPDSVPHDLDREITLLLVRGEVGRSGVTIAVRKLAMAKGYRNVGEALFHLAAVALAWRARLIGSGTEFAKKAA